MVVTVIPVGVMQVAVDEIADMAPMRHGFVAATGAVDMSFFVASAIVVRRAAVRVRVRDFDHMLIDMVVMGVVKVPVVKIVHVIAVADGGVTAIRAVLMRMVGVVGKFACGHLGAPHGYCTLEYQQDLQREDLSNGPQVEETGHAHGVEGICALKGVKNLLKRHTIALIFMLNVHRAWGNGVYETLEGCS